MPSNRTSRPARRSPAGRSAAVWVSRSCGASSTNRAATSASAAYTAHHYPGRPLYVLASKDALTEFDGQHLLTAEEADAPDAEAVAVVVGDSPEAVSFDNLNRAFRLIRGGAELIGMHK